jgi:hypothetical protein
VKGKSMELSNRYPALHLNAEAEREPPQVLTALAELEKATIMVCESAEKLMERLQAVTAPIPPPGPVGKDSTRPLVPMAAQIAQSNRRLADIAERLSFTIEHLQI